MVVRNATGRAPVQRARPTSPRTSRGSIPATSRTPRTTPTPWARTRTAPA